MVSSPRLPPPCFSKTTTTNNNNNKKAYYWFIIISLIVITWIKSSSNVLCKVNFNILILDNNNNDVGNIDSHSHSQQTQQQQQQQQQRAQDNKEAQHTRRTTTDAGIDVSNPALYEEETTYSGSNTATVIGMGTGYDLEVYERFVGSLRSTGYRGNILLLVSTELDPEIQQYFADRQVTYRSVEMIPPHQCQQLRAGNDGISSTTTTKSSYLNPRLSREHCVKRYPQLKARWARYPLLRDFLRDCTECTGPVLYLDVRDAFFQRNPFDFGIDNSVTGLQLYEEHDSHRTTHWFVADPLRQCKGVAYDEPNLCSGSTVGTRSAMLTYLNAMYAELQVWAKTPNCTFSDQPLHNYMYYSGQLPFATTIKNQRGGIVNTVYIAAKKIVEKHKKAMLAKHPNIPGPGRGLEKAALQFPFEGAVEGQNKRWIGNATFPNGIDDEGYFLELDGTRSRAVHKWDRFSGGVDAKSYKTSYYYKHFIQQQVWYNDAYKIRQQRQQQQQEQQQQQRY